MHKNQTALLAKFWIARRARVTNSGQRMGSVLNSANIVVGKVSSMDVTVNIGAAY